MIQRRAKEQARQIRNCPKTRSPQSPAPAIPNEQQFLLLSLIQRLVSLCDIAFGVTHLCPENQEEEDANSSYVQTTRFALPSLQSGLLLHHWMHQATRAQLQPPRARRINNSIAVGLEIKKKKVLSCTAERLICSQGRGKSSAGMTSDIEDSRGA